MCLNFAYQPRDLLTFKIINFGESKKNGQKFLISHLQLCNPSHSNKIGMDIFGSQSRMDQNL